VYHSPIDKVVLFDYQMGRGMNAPMGMLKDFQGYLQSDGYAVYDRIGARDGITHLGCWAHARREFIKARSSDKQNAEIAWLYPITLCCRAKGEGCENESRAEKGA